MKATTNIAINTETQDEWDQVREIIGFQPRNPDTRWKHYCRNTVLLSETHGFASVAWAQQQGIPVVKASNWLRERNAKTEDMPKPKHDPILSWISRHTGISYGSLMALVIALAEYIMIHK